MSTCGSLLEKPQRIAESPIGKHRVLIIDDDEAMTETLARRLHHVGFDTDVASSGEEGLGKARATRPDLVILDLRLPDRDGLNVCAELADDAATCAIPVIILSGLETPDILRRCRAAGCHYFLHKPYDPNALLILIREAIRQVGSWEVGEVG